MYIIIYTYIYMFYTNLYNMYNVFYANESVCCIVKSMYIANLCIYTKIHCIHVGCTI